MMRLDSNPHSIVDDSTVHGMSGRMRLQKHNVESQYNSTIKSSSHKTSPVHSIPNIMTYTVRSYKKNWMEIERSHLQAYEYLCHLSEAKLWLETCLNCEIEEIDPLGTNLQNGVLLAKLAKVFCPSAVKRIYMGEKLTYKHSDNIHFFLEACKKIGLPTVFLFELTDLYSRKNIPKVIYCIHALSHLLHKKDLAPNIQDLVGYLDFTDDQLQTTKRELDVSGLHFPAFLNVSYDLNRAMEGTASLRIKSKKRSKSRKGTISSILNSSSGTPSTSASNTLTISNLYQLNQNADIAVNKDSLRKIPKHMATLNTYSAINLIKNGFSSVKFNPTLTLSKKDDNNAKPNLSRSNPGTMSFLPSYGWSLRSNNSVNYDSKHSRSTLSHITYTDPKDDFLLDETKISNASLRVVGKRRSRKFQKKLDEINQEKTIQSKKEETKDNEKTKLQLLSPESEGDSENTASSYNASKSQHILSSISSKEGVKNSSNSGSYSGSIFNNFHAINLPSGHPLSRDSSEAKVNSIQNNDNLKGKSSLLEKIQQIYKTNNDQIINKAEPTSFKNIISKRKDVSKLSYPNKSFTSSSMSHADTRASTISTTTLGSEKNKDASSNIFNMPPSISSEKTPMFYGLKTTLESSENSSQSKSNLIQTPIKHINSLEYSKGRMNTRPGRGSLYNKDRYFNSSNPSDSSSSSSVEETRTFHSAKEIQSNVDKELEGNNDFNSKKIIAQNKYNKDTSEILGMNNSEDIYSSINSIKIHQKPKRDVHKLYGIKTLPNRNLSSNSKISSQDIFSSSGSLDANLTKKEYQKMPKMTTATTQTSPIGSWKINGTSSLSSKFAKFINSIDKGSHKSSRRALTQLESYIENDKYENDVIKDNISKNPPENVPMLKEDSGLTDSPKSEEEILEIDLEKSDSENAKETRDSSLIHTLDTPSEPIVLSKVQELNLNNLSAKSKVIDTDDEDPSEPLKLECYSFDTMLDQKPSTLNDDSKPSQEEVPFEWERYEPFIVMAQSYVRGTQQRKRLHSLKYKLETHVDKIKILQAIARGCLTRLYTMEPIYQIRTIRECIDENLVESIQAVARKVLVRHKFIPKLLEARAQAAGFFHHLYMFQALARRILVQRKWTYCLSELHNNLGQVIEIQAMIRGFLTREFYRKCFVVPEKEVVIYPQRNYGLMSPSNDFKQYQQLMRFQNNYLKYRPYVTKVPAPKPPTRKHSLYHKLASKQNTISIKDRICLDNEHNTESGISSMQSLLPLLEDSEKDFAQELELEELRRESIKMIRDISQTESKLNDLDIKIALLVRNRITLEEVIRLSRTNGVLGGNNLGTSGSGAEYESMDNNTVSLKKLDKENRKRLEGYQELFYLLQTQPQYLAKLLRLINQNNQPSPQTSESEPKSPSLNLLSSDSKRFFETVVLTLYGFAQNKREEFMLLNLFKKAIQIELEDIVRIEDFLRGNPVFIKLAVHYNRGAKERKYLRDLLQPIIISILEDPDIDLQTNPLLIYRALIKQEELITGEKSMRPYDVNAETALNDTETRTVLIKHLQQLRSITDQFIERIYASLDQMPYGIRYIAKELKNQLIKKFPNERESVIIKIVGHLVYYRYINPAIVAPESFDVIETEISPHHRRCLAEVAKMLNQVSMGKLFNDDNIFLQPLNTYVAYTSEKFRKYIYSVTEVVEPETQFEIDELLDLTYTKKPVIYISPNEIYSLHRMLSANLELISSGSNDPLNILLNEIGDPPNVPADQHTLHSKEISLHLVNRFPSINESDCDMKHMFVETKRLTTYVLRVQSGTSLLEILQKPVGPSEEARFKEILQKERPEVAEGKESEHKHKLIDIRSMSFSHLKQLAFNNSLKLEAAGTLRREDNYQLMINSIAADIRSKSKRRLERADELRRIHQTLENLKIKERYLHDQKIIYQDYLSSCMNMHCSRRSNRNKTPIPFTKQYFHLKEMSKQGSEAQFGSVKYSAERLYQKGIIISIKSYSPKQYDKIHFVLSSHEVGQFKANAYYSNSKLGSEHTISLEELLQAQFDNVLVLDLLDGEIKVNVNLLVHFINKKFYY